MSRQNLTNEDEKKAKKLYEEFHKKYPDIKNPTDINSEEKYNFFMNKSYEELSLMQRARKQAYSFTKL